MSDWRFLSLDAIHWIWPILGLLVWCMNRVWGERETLKPCFSLVKPQLIGKDSSNRKPFPCC